MPTLIHEASMADILKGADKVMFLDADMQPTSEGEAVIVKVWKGKTKMFLNPNVEVEEGGPTSGNWGHDGRPGIHGGSSGGGGHEKVGAPKGATRSAIVSKARDYQEKKYFDKQEKLEREKKEQKAKGDKSNPKHPDAKLKDNPLWSKEERQEYIQERVVVKALDSKGPITGERAEGLTRSASKMLERHPDEVIESFLEHGFIRYCGDEESFARNFGGGGMTLDESRRVGAYFRPSENSMTFRSRQSTTTDFFDHELGHYIHDNSTYGRRWTGIYRINSDFDRFTSYARNDPYEGFAETYQAWMSRGMPDPDRVRDPQVADTYRTMSRVIGGIP